MGRTILFTPVGGTDPISSQNCRDGSMLHICRVYKPDKVILYMSKEMLAFQKTDDRYRYCIEHLGNLLNHTFEVEVIEREKLTKVYEFDYFYQDFRSIVGGIFEKMEKGDTLLLNISSGTPAMKSGLAVLQTLEEYPAKLIQVVTPEKGINEHHHKGYDVETLWELNEDNEPDFENRCREVECPTLSCIKREEIIKKHIKVYDYQAALDTLETLPGKATDSYRALIELAAQRLLLNFSAVDRLLRETGIQCLPVRASSERKYFEYALSVAVKLKKEEYADFIRAITPLIVDLFEMILKKQCNIDINDYCEDNKSNIRKWSSKKLEGTQVGEILNREYQNRFQAKDVYSIHLKILIENISEDKHLIQLINHIRAVEESVRNLAAHQIVSITDEVIRQKTGFTSAQIMDMIKELFSYTEITVKKDYWDSYDQMNKLILDRMSIYH